MMNNGVDILLMTNNFGYKSYIEPAGISILAGILKHDGFTTCVLEPAVWAWDVQQCIAYVNEQRPKILALSILIDANMKQINELIDGVKEKNPDTVVIAGGQAITMNYREEKYEDFYRKTEFFMVGESESTISSLVNCLLRGEDWKTINGIVYKENGEIIVNPPAKPVMDLDEIPMMDRTVLGELLKQNGDYRETSVQYGRGCRHACSFCSIGQLFKTKDSTHCLRRRSLDKVYEEIEYLFYEYGIRRFNIEDESFLETGEDEKKAIIRFCQRIKKLPEKVALMFLGRIDCVDEEVCKELLEAGTSYMFLGIDSAVDEDLKLFNKGYTKETVYKNMKMLMDLGYSADVDSEHRVAIGYITWHPYTTRKGLRESLQFCLDFHNTPKLLQHKLFLFGTTPLKKKIENDGLMVDSKLDEGSFEFNWRFQNEGIQELCDCVMTYFDEWSPFRDGIRTLEKYVMIEKPEAKKFLENLILKRKDMDKQFLEFFEVLLEASEDGKDNSIYQQITENYIRKIGNVLTEQELQQIDAFYKKYEFEGNVIEDLKSGIGILMRYRN